MTPELQQRLRAEKSRRVRGKRPRPFPPARHRPQRQAHQPVAFQHPLVLSWPRTRLGARGRARVLAYVRSGGTFLAVGPSKAVRASIGAGSSSRTLRKKASWWVWIAPWMARRSKLVRCNADKFVFETIHLRLANQRFFSFFSLHTV